MPKLSLSREARDDLVSIGQYTQDKWGLAKRDAYLNQFAEAFERVRTGRAAEHLRDDLGPGLRSILVGSHVAFFRRDEDMATILRILHQSQDYARHL